MKHTQAPKFKVVYEDLCRDQDPQLERICNFMGVPLKTHWKPYTIDDVHLTGNRTRFKFNGNVRQDEKWKEYFSGSDLNKIRRGTQKYVEEFGISYLFEGQ